MTLKVVLLYCYLINRCRKQLLLKTAFEKQPYVELRGEHVVRHMDTVYFRLFVVRDHC